MFTWEENNEVILVYRGCQKESRNTSNIHVERFPVCWYPLLNYIYRLEQNLSTVLNIKKTVSVLTNP